MARTSKIVLKKKWWEWKFLSCSWFQRKCFQFFTTGNEVCCGFVICVLHLLSYVPPMPTFWRSFMYYHKLVLHFVKSIFCIYWDDHIVFILQFINMVCVTDWFAYVDVFLYSWDKSQLIMMYEHFNVLLQSFSSILLRISVSLFICDIGLHFFFCDIFVWFWYQNMRYF